MSAARPALLRTACLLAPPFVVAVLFMVVTHGALRYEPDSPSYMYFDPSRPVGYPAFVYVVHQLTGGYRAIPPIQYILLAASMACLALSVRKITASFWLALATEFVSLANPSYWTNCSALLSEALSSTVLNLFAAVGLLYLHRQRPLAAIALLALIAVGITIRPVNVTLGAAGLVALLLIRREPGLGGVLRTCAAGVAVVLAMAVGYFATPLSQYVAHGRAVASSPLARGLLQKTMFDVASPAPSAADPSDVAIITAATQPARDYIATAPPRVRPALERTYSDYLRFKVIIPQIAHRHGVEAGWRVDPTLSEFATAQISAHPLDYLDRVVVEDLRLLSYQDFRDRGTQAQFAQFLAHNPPPNIPASRPLGETRAMEMRAEKDLGIKIPPPSSKADIKSLAPRATLIVLSQRLFHTGVAVVGFCALIAALLLRVQGRTVTPLLAGLAVLGCVLHAQTLLTTTSEYGLPRYVNPLWALQCAIYGLCVALLLDLRGRRVLTDLPARGAANVTA
jgi:hypothetical protein